MGVVSLCLTNKQLSHLAWLLGQTKSSIRNVDEHMYVEVLFTSATTFKLVKLIISVGNNLDFEVL